MIIYKIKILHFAITIYSCISCDSYNKQGLFLQRSLTYCSLQKIAVFSVTVCLSQQPLCLYPTGMEANVSTINTTSLPTKALHDCSRTFYTNSYSLNSLFSGRKCLIVLYLCLYISKAPTVLSDGHTATTV
jgi:hypothetical protein